MRKHSTGLYILGEQEKHLSPFPPPWDLLCLLRWDLQQSVLSDTWVEAAKGTVLQKGKESVLFFPSDTLQWGGELQTSALSFILI